MASLCLPIITDQHNHTLLLLIANCIHSAVACRLILYVSNVHAVKFWWNLSRLCYSNSHVMYKMYKIYNVNANSEFKNDFTCVVLICVEINCPGNWFKMAILGCMSLVLVDN